MKTITGLYCFLTGTILFSILLGYAGIARIKRFHLPPFAEPSMGGFAPDFPVPDRLLLFADTMGGCAAIWLAAVTIPILSGIGCFKHQRVVLSMTVLMLWATLFAWFGFRLWMHAKFDVFPVE